MTLKNGEKLLLADKVYVCYDNDGVLVFGSEDNDDYLSWSEIEEINITDLRFREEP